MNHVGCVFPYITYVPGVILVLHDGADTVTISPTKLVNLRLECGYARFSLAKNLAKQLGWVKK